jgi:glucan phosphorylase
MAKPSVDAPTVGYFCAEFAVHDPCPSTRAGSARSPATTSRSRRTAAAARRRRLMYHQGYFRQRLDASGWQHEYR